MKRYFQSELTDEQYDNARKWIAALRSGTYKQGKDNLKKANFENTESKFCCLGVAFDLFGKQIGVTEKLLENGISVYECGEEFSDSVLLVPVSEKIGLDSQKGIARDNKGSILSTCLAEDNDNGMSFDEIAKNLEDHLNSFVKTKDKWAEVLQESV